MVLCVWCCLQAFSGIVLSAFFAGYAATQVLGGKVAIHANFVLSAAEHTIGAIHVSDLLHCYLSTLA